MKVFAAVANAFVKEGTTTVFGVLGDGHMSWWESLAKHPGMKIVDARDEGAALSMADGWVRATGKVGVCGVTQGPGIARIANSLIMSTRSHRPIVVYTSKTPFNKENASQYLDQDRFVSATGAGYIEVLKADFAETAVRTAFYRAKIESRPIVLCVPRDIARQECDSDGDDYQPSATLYRGQQKIQPDVDSLNEAFQIIAESKKPVLVLGRGAMSPEATAAADRLAKRIGALVSTTLLAKGTLSDYEYHAGVSGLFSTRSAMQLFAEADCVIALGATLSERTIEGGHIFPNARTIQVNVAPHVLMGNLKSADCYIQADATVTLQAIDALLEKKGISQTGYRTAEVKKILRDSGRDPAEYEIEPGTVDPREAARLIDERMPADVSLVTGGGHSFTVTTMVMQKARPLHAVVHSDWGSIGQAMATAIGIGVGLNGKPLMHMEGDGSAMQNIQELDTAARLQVKILFVIWNDQGFGAEYQKLRSQGKDLKIAFNRSPDFVAVAKGFGCRGRLAKTLDEIVLGIDEFLAGEGPMVLDIRISRNVISIPYRRLNYGEDV